MQQGSNVSAGAAGETAVLTDEQILDMEPVGTPSGSDSSATASSLTAQDDRETLGSPDERREQLNDDGAKERRNSSAASTADPEWLKALDAQPEAAAEARRWRQAALDAAALDTDYFSAEPGARAALAARLHQTDPEAFRAMLADAARILADRDPQGLAELARQLGGAPQGASNRAASKSVSHAARGVAAEAQASTPAPSGATSTTDAFPADSYRQFAAAMNDDVERQVRDSIDRTLSTTLPDGIADGARRRIGEDILRDLNTTLSSDRELAAKINDSLRGWRFDAATRQQVAGLLAGRARMVLPEVARRVVSEWTSSVLASDRAKNARIESAASRRDITGGRLPEQIASSALRPKQFDYARTSDEQILEM